MRPPSTRSKSKLPTTSRADYTYVYAVVDGRPNACPQQAIPDGAPPHAIPLEDNISLVVSRVPSQTYNAAALEGRLADMDWVSAAGAAHHGVIDALVTSGLVVLPFRLFTLYSSEERAIDDLRPKAPTIRRALARVRGCEEWVLQIGAPDASRRPPEPAVAATTGTSFLAAKAAAKRSEIERGARAREGAAQVIGALTPLAAAARVKPVSADGRLISEAAFLLAPSGVERMKDALAAASEQLLRDGCPISFTGPWPPYSFSSLDSTEDG
jgi:hypothetical protein